MKHKVAVLLDGGYVIWELRKIIQRRPSSDEIDRVAHQCYSEDKEDLFRIYFYDCLPFDGETTHPVTGKQINFKDNNTYRYRSGLYAGLAQKDNISFRKGQLKFRDWKIKSNEMKRIIKHDVPVDKWRLKPDLKQKGVDIKIGLDISWLSSKRIVDRIVLFTGDTDFVPAMKFARREGVQVIIASFRDDVPAVLREHADGFRLIKPSINTSD